MRTDEMRPHRAGGTTLLELVIALVIVALLATLALPSYRRYVLQANRADGRAALLALAAAQEKFYLACNEYAASLDDTTPSNCSPSTLRFPSRSEHGLYAVAITAADTVSWSATAVVSGGSPQAADSHCHTLQLDSTGRRSAVAVDGAPGDAACWTR
jgi:type IV pilus assembly protein PilE